MTNLLVDDLSDALTRIGTLDEYVTQAAGSWGDGPDVPTGFGGARLNILSSDYTTSSTTVPPVEELDKFLADLLLVGNRLTLHQDLLSLPYSAAELEAIKVASGYDVHGDITKEDVGLLLEDMSVLHSRLMEVTMLTTRYVALQDALATATTAGTSVPMWDWERFPMGYHTPPMEEYAEKYNKYTPYVAETADEENGTFFKIGPISYGGEVQDIKILETKALTEITAIRSSTSFVADTGQADADVQVTLVFSGTAHIQDAFKPLIALFKLSPITSVRNEMINKALENKFTENKADVPVVEVREAGVRALNMRVQDAHKASLVNAYNLAFPPVPGLSNLDYDQIEAILLPTTVTSGISRDPIAVWKEILDKGGYDPGQALSADGTYTNKYPTFGSWKEDLIDRNFNVVDPYLTLPEGTPEPITVDADDPAHDENPYAASLIDNTGHVPMAMNAMNISTHPELPNTIVVDLYLKRINVRNFLKDHLEYRTIDNNATSDPNRAFWLNYAIQLYIEKYIPDEALDFDRVRLQFEGKSNDGGQFVELASFKESEGLDILDLNPGRAGSTAGATPLGNVDGVVTQMSYSLSNHLAYHKLIGEAYPTAQFMGSVSNGLNMTIVTNDSREESTFEKIHTYSSAADFFSRHIDRLGRLQGWDVDCFMTKLFSNRDPSQVDHDPASSASATTPEAEFDRTRRLYYPKALSSVTSPENPGLKTVHLSFAETSPDWFANFGFVIKDGRYNITDLYTVFNIFLENSQAIREGNVSDPETNPAGGALEYLSYVATWGLSSNPDVWYSLVNRESIIAAMMESKIYGEADGELEIEMNQIGLDIAHFLGGDEIWRGTEHLVADYAGGGANFFDSLGSIWRGISASPFGFGDNVELPRDIARRMVRYERPIEPEDYVSLATPDIDTLAAAPRPTLAEDLGVGVLTDGGEEAFFEVPVGDYELYDTLVRHLTKIPITTGRTELLRLLKNNNKIQFTKLFTDRLFAAIVRRRRPIFDDRLYESGGLLQAWEALIVAFESHGAAHYTDEELAGDEDINTLNNLGAGLAQRKERDTMIVVDSLGKVKKSEELVTAYPDYPYMTYEKLFDLPEPRFKNNWRRFALTYQDMGILNMNKDDFEEILGGDAHAAEQFDVVAAKAQKRPITLKGTPVPPSVYFWRESEFDSLYHSLDETSNNYFNKLESLTINIPLHIEGLTADGELRAGDTVRETLEEMTGEEIADDDDRLMGLGQRNNLYLEQLKRVNQGKIKDAAFDITSEQLMGMASTLNISSWTDLHKKLNTGGLEEEFYLALAQGGGLAGQAGAKKKGYIVPIMLFTNKNAPIGTSYRFSGASGEAIATAIQYQHMRNLGDSASWREYIDSVIVANATGIDGPSQSGANVGETRLTMQKIMQGVKDNGNDMIKAFPTMRFYLIDFRGPRIVVQDSFYGYNAVESVDITLDKNDADLAIIRLSDPYGLLQGMYYGVEGKEGNIIEDEALTTSANNSGQSNILARIALKQGRAVQLRGGYSSDPANLDILFTGRIAEIQFGDVVTIVCQGWKSELISKEIQFEETRRKNLGVQDLVIAAIRYANPAGLGQVFSGVEFKFIREFGKNLSTQGELEHSAGVAADSAAMTNQLGASAGVSGGPFGLFSGRGRGLDMRLKNIWIPDVNSSLVQQFGFGSIVNSGWDAARFVVPLQPAWSVLQAATNYCWGYICQVVPYDGAATLFFGKPDQMYFATQGSHRDAAVYKAARISSFKFAGEQWRTILEDWIEQGEASTFSSANTGRLEQLITTYESDYGSDLNWGDNEDIPFKSEMPGALLLNGNQFEVDLETHGWENMGSLAGRVYQQENAYLPFRDAWNFTTSVAPGFWGWMGEADWIPFLGELGPDWLGGGERPIPEFRIIIKNNWVLDMEQSYNELQSEFGSTTAIFLLASYFGVSPKIIETKVRSNDELVRALLTGYHVWGSQNQDTDDGHADLSELIGRIQNDILIDAAHQDAVKEQTSPWNEEELDEFIRIINDTNFNDDSWAGDAVSFNELGSSSYYDEYTADTTETSEFGIDMKFDHSLSEDQKKSLLTLFAMFEEVDITGYLNTGIGDDTLQGTSPYSLALRELYEQRLRDGTGRIEPGERQEGGGYITRHAWYDRESFQFQHSFPSMTDEVDMARLKLGSGKADYGSAIYSQRTRSDPNVLQGLANLVGDDIFFKVPGADDYWYGPSDPSVVGTDHPDEILIRRGSNATTTRFYYHDPTNPIAIRPILSALKVKALMIFQSEKSKINQGLVQPRIEVGRKDWRDFGSRIAGTSAGRFGFEEALIDSRHVMNFRAFVYFFNLHWKEVKHQPEMKEIADSLKSIGSFEWRKCLNMKVFRDYHYILDHKDILQNNIAATTREMHNTVLVKYPSDLETSNDGFFHWISFGAFKGDYNDVQIEGGTEWTTYPKDEENVGMQFNPTVAFENKKISVYTDLNISRQDQACKVATNWLAKRMRPMYRGNLMLTGRAMKPWDRLILNDKYTEMYGPLEVERVVHHFSAQTGWVTNIIPHAVVDANPGNKFVQDAIFANRMDQIFDLVDTLTWAITIAMAIPTAGASVATFSAGRAAMNTAIKVSVKQAEVAALKTAGLTFAKQFGVAKSAIWNTFIKSGSLHLGKAVITYPLNEITRLTMIQSGMKGSQMPTIYSPLAYKGAPLVAGMEASEYTTFSVAAKVHWALRDMYDGMTSLIDGAFDNSDSASAAGISRAAMLGSTKWSK
jgi:hypothetical protein